MGINWDMTIRSITSDAVSSVYFKKKYWPQDNLGVTIRHLLMNGSGIKQSIKDYKKSDIARLKDTVKKCVALKKAGEKDVMSIGKHKYFYDIIINGICTKIVEYRGLYLQNAKLAIRNKNEDAIQDYWDVFDELLSLIINRETLYRKKINFIYNNMNRYMFEHVFTTDTDNMILYKKEYD